FVIGCRGRPPRCSRGTFELTFPPLRVISQQTTVHELIHRAATHLSDSLNPANETAQNDHLRFSRSLLLFALERDKLDGVEVDGEERVIDRRGQIALIAPLLAKQLIEADQQANIEYIKADWSTYCHGAAPTFSRDRRGILPGVLSVRHIYITL